MSQTIIRDALCEQEELQYLLAPLPLDRHPESLVSPAEHPDYGFIIKAISTSHFTQLGRFNLTCDLRYVRNMSHWWWQSLRIFLYTTCQMVATINESTLHNFFTDIRIVLFDLAFTRIWFLNNFLFKTKIIYSIYRENSVSLNFISVSFFKGKYEVKVSEWEKSKLIEIYRINLTFNLANI